MFIHEVVFEADFVVVFADLLRPVVEGLFFNDVFFRSSIGLTKWALVEGEGIEFGMVEVLGVGVGIVV